ncbi:uncharacterized protein [Amphiura filiformis]|uniref:uncharacterized protein n=1 Tax=Amphiura filiformis TaxID=82378 RepID=UPI003B214ADE
MENYEQLHEIASRDWFNASSVSLAKLDQVKAAVYNISPNQTHQPVLRPASAVSVGGRGQRALYTNLQTEPPLSTVNIQQSSWNNNPSVPNLIKQQGERQQRVASAKGPRRPWSGRKVPPSPTRQKLDKQQEQDDKKFKAFIAVTGSKYDPKSRPPSGRPTSGRPTSGVAPPGRVDDSITKRVANSTLEDFLNSYRAADGETHDLAKLSAAYAPEDALTPPPPVPRTSPDIQEMLDGDTVEDIHHMLYGEETGDISDEEEKAERIRMGRSKDVVKQSSAFQLLRRPTPEPVRLSMTIPMMGNVSDEEDDMLYERYDESPSALDMELQSVTSDVSGNIDVEGAFTNEDEWSGGIRSITMTSRHPTTPVTPGNITPSNRDVTTAAGDTENYQINEEGEGNKARHSVHIANTYYVTDVSNGCEVGKEPLKPHPPSAKARPRSAVTSIRTHHSDVKSTDGVKQRPKSARVKNLKVATVALDYGTQSDVKELDGHVETKESRIKKKHEIETMMSRISLSDEENDLKDSKTNKPKEHNVQYSKSSSKTNYYKAATAPSQATLTTKTIAFTDAGIQESKSVSKIGQVQVTDKPHVGRWIGGNKQEQTRGIQRTHSAITRPMRTNSTLPNKPQERPSSRMGCRLDDDNLSDNNDKVQSDCNSTLKKVSRPVSAPVKRRGISCGRKSPSKVSSRRPKSAVVSRKQSYLDKPHVALQPGSQSMKGVTPPAKKSAQEKERSRAAVKALREGTLNKEKKYTGQIAYEETKQVIEYTPRRQESSESSSEEEIEIPMSEQEKQMQEIHERLLAKGVNVSAKTLARGLLPPANRGYDECSGQLPEKASMTLLNHPEAWLGDVFKKYKMAERALHHANIRMMEQSEMDAKQALENAKKKKRKKGKKRKVKKKSSKNSTNSTAAT